jgi:hypothetical protein
VPAETRPGKPDPHKPVQVAVVGKKGSGKSELAFLYFDSYPFDRATIDPAGDLKMPEDTYELTTPLPARWPGETVKRVQAEMGQRPHQQTLRFVPHFHEPDYLEDMDRVVGMAFAHGRTCLFVDECHEAAPAGRTPPHMRRALRQGRHADLTLILATPRPLTVDPLVISQADYTYIFKLPNPNDRKRVAENIGWHPKDFDEAVHSLGDFSYLRYDAANDDLARFPPLPQSSLKYHHSAAA